MNTIECMRVNLEILFVKSVRYVRKGLEPLLSTV